MKTRLIFIALFVFYSSAVFAETTFQVETVLNPVINVAVDAGDETQYSTNKRVNIRKSVQARGQCKKKWKISNVSLISSGGTLVLKTSDSGDRSLTPNDGQSWRNYEVNIDIPANQNSLIQQCNNEASRLIQEEGKSYAEVYGAGFEVKATSGDEVELSATCKDDTIGFNDPPVTTRDTTELPILLQCQATGYQAPAVKVKKLPFQVTPIATQFSNVCQVNVQGSIETNYPDYSAQSAGATRSIKYRYHYKSTVNTNQSNSSWITKNLSGDDNGIVNFDYTSDVSETMAEYPGEVWLEVDTGDEIYESKKKGYVLNCNHDKDVSLNTSIPTKATMRIEVLDATRDWREGKWCPNQIRVISSVTAGTSDLVGNATFSGQSLADVRVEPLDMAAQTTRQIAFTKDLQWPSTTGSLSTNAQNTADSITLQLGLTVTNANSDIVASVPRDSYTFACEAPQTQFESNNTLKMEPKHTGGGGNPTTVTAGQQQSSSASSAKRKLGGNNASQKIQIANGKLAGADKQASRNVVKDSHDRYANEEASHLAKPTADKQAKSIGLKSRQSQSASAKIQSNEKPDIIIRALNVAHGSIQKGGASTLNADDAVRKENGLCYFDLSYSLENKSKVKTAPFRYELKINKKKVNEHRNIVLLAGKFESYSYVGALKSGLNTITLDADKGNKVVESNENNNKQVKKYSVVGDCDSRSISKKMLKPVEKEKQMLINKKSEKLPARVIKNEIKK